VRKSKDESKSGPPPLWVAVERSAFAPDGNFKTVVGRRALAIPDAFSEAYGAQPPSVTKIGPRTSERASTYV
jgi:hypothetical protein